jgi:hypothetical protein
MDWKLRVKWLVGSILVLSCSPGVIAQTDSQLDIKTVAASMEKRFQACPGREIIAQFDRKHHKQVWQKQVWGPPTDLFADAKANDDNSVLYPYVLTIEFSLKTTFGSERPSKADAENDSDLAPAEGVPPALLTGRYRNTYLVGKDAIRLKKTEFLDRKFFSDAPSEWKERAPWPDACWDQVAVK